MELRDEWVFVMFMGFHSLKITVCYQWLDRIDDKICSMTHDTDELVIFTSYLNVYENEYCFFHGHNNCFNVLCKMRHIKALVIQCNASRISCKFDTFSCGERFSYRQQGAYIIFFFVFSTLSEFLLAWKNEEIYKITNTLLTIKKIFWILFKFFFIALARADVHFSIS